MTTPELELIALIAIIATSSRVHFWGDYFLQWYEIAMNKRLAPHLGFDKNIHNLCVALVHGFLYGLPFFAYRIEVWQYLAIALSHSFVDYFAIGALGVRLFNRDWGDWTKVKPKAPNFVALTWDQETHKHCNIFILSIPYWHCWHTLWELWHHAV